MPLLQVGREILRLIFVLVLLTPAFGLANDASGGGYPITAVPFSDVRLTDAFWAPRIETNRAVTIPFGFAKSEEEGRIRNFERAARHEGPYEGKMPFDDTDVYKLIEGAAYSLQNHPDPELDRFLEGIITKIAAAQEPDGYLTTYKTIDPTKSPAEWLKPGPKWELELEGSHELYNSGHLYEAAYAHYRATGRRTLLDVALKNADLIDRTFGPGKRTTPPGHQIIETGLVKLSNATGERRYRDLARFFLDQRGRAATRKLYGTYNQDHLPVIEQSEAVGHAVRAAYMYSGMVDIAALDADPLYRAAVERIWDDVVSRKLYVTGAIGARHKGEAFGDAFELPNRTAYGETCASIANVYWNQRMFLLSGDARYVDVLERSLYNAALAGVSLGGNTFFYPNPLESDGRYAFNQGALTRKPWFDSSCCPTNLARFIPSMPDYIYAVEGDALYVNLFAASRASADVGGTRVAVQQTGEYPWDGRIELRITPDRPRALELRVRIPGWARNVPCRASSIATRTTGAAYELRVNGEPTGERRGYAVIARFSKRATWSRSSCRCPSGAWSPTIAWPRTRARSRSSAGRSSTRRGGRQRGRGARSRRARRRRLDVERRPDLLGGVAVVRERDRPGRRPRGSWRSRTMPGRTAGRARWPSGWRAVPGRRHCGADRSRGASPRRCASPRTAADGGRVHSWARWADTRNRHDKRAGARVC